jgi:hypothetical protein
VNHLETSIRETIIDKIKDFNLFFNKVKVDVCENKKYGFIDISFKTEISFSQRISLKELWKVRFDLLGLITRNTYRRIQELLFEELGNNLKKDKNGLKLIVSPSIPKGIILCDPYTAARVGMINQMLECGHPAFRKEFDELLEEGIECETYI